MTAVEWAFLLFGVAMFVLFVAGYRHVLWLRQEMQNAQQRQLDAEQLMRHQQGELERARRLLEVHMGANQSFEEQRNTIWQLYRLASLEAGNAQELLFRELNRAATELNEYRKKDGKKPFRFNEDLEEVIDHFRMEHGKGRSNELVVGEEQVQG